MVWLQRLRWSLLLVIVAGLGVLCGLSVAEAQGMNETQLHELKEAFQAGADVASHGPAQISLQDQAILTLPGQTAFIPTPQAARLMRAMGNSVSENNFLGLVIPTSGQRWIVALNFHKDGYIKDDDAKNWDVAALLQSVKDGTEEVNQDRRRQGFPEMDIEGWQQAPVYNPTTQQLVWSLVARDKTATADRTINYNTYGLGRDGYISLNLITDPATIDQDKNTALALLAGLNYVDGKRYQDYKSGDNVATYGIAALVGLGIAKKAGLLAGAGLLFAKFFKVIAIAVLAGLALLRRILGGKAKPVAPAASSGPSSEAPPAEASSASTAEDRSRTP